MPGKLFLQVETSAQGNIEGSVTQVGFENKIGVYHTHHLVDTQIDVIGRVRGRGTIHPLIITKDIDKATVPFYNAWYRNEMVTQFILEYYRVDQQGALSLYYTIELEQARIESIEQILVENDLGMVVEREVVKFASRKITWTFADGGLMALAGSSRGA